MIPALEVTEKDLERMCRYWQKKLRLTDWKVTIRFASWEELKDCQADNETYAEPRIATLRILNAREYIDKYLPTMPNQPPQDVEDSVVHELIHVHIDPSWPVKNKHEDMLREQVIESLAGAYVSLHRYHPRKLKTIVGVTDAVCRDSEISECSSGSR